MPTPDKVEELYNALKADGAVQNSLDYFRGYMSSASNRKQLYEALKADGAVTSGTFEEFDQKLGYPYNTHDMNEANAVDEASNRARQAQEQQAQRKTRYDVAQEQYEQGRKQTDATPISQTAMGSVGGYGISPTGMPVRNTQGYPQANPQPQAPDKPMAPAPKAGQWSGAPMQQTPYAPTEEEGNKSFRPIEQGEDTRQAYAGRKQAKRDLWQQQNDEIEGMVADEQDKLNSTERVFNPVTRMYTDKEGKPIKTTSDRLQDLQAAQRAMRNSKRIIDAADAKSGFWQGMKDHAFDLDKWDFGITDIKDLNALKRAVEAYDKGEELTDSQQALLDAKALEMAVNVYFSSELSRGYTAGQDIGTSLPYMAAFMTGIGSAVGKGTTKSLIKYFTKRFAKTMESKAGRTALKGVSRVAGDFARAADMTATIGGVRTATGAQQRMMGQTKYDEDEQGDVRYAGHTEGESALKAVGKEALSRTLTNFSEMFGEYLGFLGKGGRWLSGTKGGKFFGLDKVAGFIDNVAKSDIGSFIGKIESKAEFHGAVNEMAEELFDGVTNATFVGDQTLKDVFDKENLTRTALSVGIMSMFFSGAKLGGYGVAKGFNAADMAVRTRRADRAAANAFGTQWDGVRGQLDGATAEQAADIIQGMYESGEYTDEQLQSALNYAIYKKGNEMIERYKANNQTQQEAAAEQSYNTGYEDATTDELRGGIEKAYNDARQTLVGLIGEDNVAVIDEDPLGMQRLYDNDPKVDDAVTWAVAAYVSAKSAWDGVQQRIADDAEDRAEAVREAYKPMTREDGSIHPVTLNVEGADGQPKTVYLLDGSDVVLNPDGSIDREKSSPTLTAYDPEQGKPVFIDDPYGDRGIQSVGEVTTPDALEQLAGGGVDGQGALTPQDGQGARIPDARNPEDGQGARAPERTPGAPEDYTPGMVIGVVDNAGQEHEAEVVGRVRYDKGRFVPDENGMFVEYTVDGQTKHEAADKLNDMVRWHETGGVDTIEPIEGIEGQAPTAEAETPTEGGNTAEDTRTPAQRTFDEVTAKYGDKASHKVDVTLKDRKSELDSKKKALDKAQTDYDDAPIGKEDKAEKALAKAQEEYDNALADYNSWDEVRKLRDQALIARSEAEDAARKAEQERKRVEETEAQRKQREAYEAEQARRKAEAEAVEKRRQEENARLRAEEEERKNNPQPAVEPAPIEGTKGQASQLEIARQEMADDPGALAMLEDMSPRTLEEVASRLLSSGKNQVRLIKDDFMRETGYTPEDVKRYPFVFATADKGGITLSRFGEMVAAEARNNGIPFDENDPMAGVTAALNMLGGVGSQGDINGYVAGSRIQQAYDYHNAALAAERTNMLEAYGMTDEEYESYMSWLEDAIEQGKSTLSDEEFNQIFNIYGQEQTTDAAGGNQEGAETIERPEGAETDVSQDGERGNGETDAGTAEQPKQPAVSTEQQPKAETWEEHVNKAMEAYDKEYAAIEKSDGERLRKEAAGYSDERLLNTYIRNAGISQIFGKGREGMRKFVSEEKNYKADKLDEVKENHLEAAPDAARQSYVQDVLRAELDRRGIEYKEDYTFAETSEAEDWYKKNVEGKTEQPRAAVGEGENNEPKGRINQYGVFLQVGNNVSFYDGGTIHHGEIIDFDGDETFTIREWVSKKRGEYRDVEREFYQIPRLYGKQSVADVEAGGAIVDKLEQMGVEVSADIAENRRVRKQAENDKSENGKIHELRTTDGKVYGFAYRGKLYLDPRKIDAELPLHEYAHLWTEAMRILNPKKWAEVVEQIKQDKDAWQFIHSTYPDLKTDSEIADEVIATFSGKNGAEKLKAALDRFTQNNPDYKSRWNAIFNSIAKALQDFWKAVGDFLNIKYESAEQVYDQVLKDFVGGMNPRARVEKYLQERETAYMQAAERGDVAKATEIFNQALSEEIGNGMTPFIAAGRYDRASRIPTLAHKVKSRDPKAIDEVAELIAPIIPKNAVLVPAPSHNGRATDMLDLAKAIAKRTGSEVADVLTSEPRESQYETKKRGGLIASQDMGITMTGTLPEGKIPVVIDNVVGSGNTAEACVRAIGKGLVVSLGDAADRYNHAVSLKSAAPILRDRNNNIVPLSKRFNLGGSQYLGRSAYERASSDVRFRGEEEPVFYSNAMRAVENIKQERATPEQWVKMIEKQGGMKAGEDKWLGLSEWLKGSDAKTLTKGEVLDYIRANEIQVEEVEYGSTMSDKAKKNLEEYNNEFLSKIEELDSNDKSGGEVAEMAFGVLVDRYGDDFENAFELTWDHGSPRLEPQRDYVGGFVGEAKYFLDMDGDEVGQINSTRLSYTTEGLDNKREIVLTVPTIEPWNEQDEVHFGEAGGGRAVAWVRFGETTDADGKRVLVIDEIQSKRHQEGREKGYRTKDDVAEEERLQDEVVKAQERYDDFTRKMAEKYEGTYEDIYADMTEAERQEADRLEQAVYAADNAYQNHALKDIPDAPFEKNWHEVAMKRMLRFAAENGYDKVAWTKGEQQAERYDLSTQVKRIRIARHFNELTAEPIEGEYEVYLNDKYDVPIVESNGMTGVLSEERIKEVYGKDLGQRMIDAAKEKDDQFASFEGNDLRIGGEGMKGFYDKILPRFMDKYGKKWGVKTGEVRLDGLSGSNGENGVVMHAVDVTDDMRESVMRGQPLFRPKTQSREGGEEAAQGDWYDRGSVERIGEFVGYSPKRIAAMNARQEQTARNKFRDAAEKLHLGDRITFVDTIDEIEGIGEEQRKAWRRKKGWYSPRTGKIVIILGNHKSMDDVMKSILHEGVAHHGLRQMFGVHFDTFLDNVYLLASSEIRERINDMAKKHGWDFREATEEYLATLAEDTDFERPENQSWWKKVKAMFIDLLHKIGFRLHDVYDTITDNELRYILWRSYENLVNPGRYNSVVEEAKDVAKQYELKVGRWDVEWTIEDREPNATTMYNGRRIAVWATNGRRGNRADRGDREDRTDRTDMVDRKEWIRAVAEAKRHWPGAMVLEHVGDFYVIHGEDARKVAKVLGLPLVQRSGNDTVGFPAYEVDTYLPKLVRAGERVALIDSVNEDAVVYGGENIEAEDAAEYAKHRRTAEAIKERFPEPLTMRNYKSWEVKNYLAHILGMGGWINDIHREIPYRFLHPEPTLDDYFKDTIATFKSIGKVPEDDTPNKLLAAQRVNMTRWEKMKESGKYEHHQSPLSNSEYLVDRETGDIYRLSDHWGKVASCDWDIDQRHGGERGIMQIGKCNISEFSPKNKNGKNVVINPAYIKALTGATSVAKENYRTFLDNVEMTDAVRRDVEGQITELEKNLEREIGNFGDNDIRFRDGDFSERDEVTARDYYERMVSSSRYQFREAVQDSMLGLRKAYEAILGGGKKFRIEEVPGNENAYLAENRMSSVNAAEQHNYFVECMKPLLEEIHKICGSDKALRQELTDYMMAKHGLERNRVFAERDAQNGQNALNGQGARIPERDYAGLTALTGMADVHDAELAAMQMVADFEAQHDVSKLWAATKQATGVTLAKIYLSGMLSKESYEQIRDQFEWYIPLQGFDETTSDEVYGYLTSRQGPYGSPIKHAEGRSSKADDPIATIGMMADMAIRQANRNEMKKLFLNFVLDHPSDLVSVNRLWLQYDDVSGDWMPVFADIEEGDTAADVERKVAAFEQRMEQLAAAEPKKYKHGRNAKNIPYRVLPGNLSEHQVLVKRDGETYVLTINGNPRAAQALNGLTNPDVKVGGLVGDMMKAAEWVNHNLSAAYTTRTPDFVVSNYFRDMLYSNCMTWVKEGRNYALRFHKNFGKFNPATMRVLFGKWEKGTLDESKPIEFMFKQFMLNGGETGYTNVRDIEAHKREIARELKRQGNVPRKAWHALGMQLDLVNRSVENCARFAAFITSQEMGRSVERSIYDAKEVSVNFNKKGSGGKMVNATGQTGWGKFGSYLSGSGRLLYVFWNAGTQGMTNFMRAAKHHPGKFSAGAATMFALGAIVPLLAKALGDDDDYYNLPEYVRRSNICFRFTKEMPWITIPLPIEFRAIYGLGELGTGVITGDEHYNNWELTRQLVSQVSQILPLDFMEGGGGLHAFIPSLAKPIVEAATNKRWTGLPIYRDNPFNQKDPEFTKVYKNADKNLVAASKWLNELTGGDDYKKGWADKVNPAQVEYVLNGYLGGWFNVPNQLMKMGETAFGDREFEWRNMMLANRLIKNGDERTANRKLQNEYFELKDEYEETKRLLKKYKNAADEGVLKYAEKLAFLNESKEYGRYLIFDEYRKEIDKLYNQMKEEEGEQRKATEEEYYSVVREMVDKVHKYNKGR